MNITDQEFDLNSTIHITPTNTPMHNCKDKINMTYFRASACGCTDCLESCPTPKPHPPEKICKLWGFECFTVAMMMLFVVSTVSFIVGLLVSSQLKRKNSNLERLIKEGNIIYKIYC
jgi:hypothetical protein